MVAGDTEFRFLAESAKRFVGLLAAGLPETPRKDHRGSALNEHIAATADGVLARLAETETEYEAAEDETDRAEAIKEARLLGGYARFMHRALPWLEDSIRSPLGLGALYFIDEMALDMTGERPDVVPTRSDEYSTERWPFQPIFTRLGLSVAEGRLPIILNVPALERKSFLLLPLFGHELGHTAVWKNDLVGGALARIRATQDYEQRFEEARDKLAAQTSISQQRARLILNQRLEYWTEELLCDQLAMQYLGPSYALAFATYLVALSWNEPGPRHPPTTVRINHLSRWMNKVGWDTQLRDHLPTTTRWLSVVGDTPRAGDEGPPLTFLLDVIDEVSIDIETATDSSLNQRVYLPEAYEVSGNTISELLDVEILPVQDPESHEAFDRRAILYAGWLSILTEVGDAPESLPRALSRTESQDFFTKALEMSCLLAGWRRL